MLPYLLWNENEENESCISDFFGQIFLTKFWRDSDRKEVHYMTLQFQKSWVTVKDHLSLAFPDIFMLMHESQREITE